ncbi:alpha/beta hydrolase [Geodermatophilus sp. SYSU D01105]
MTSRRSHVAVGALAALLVGTAPAAAQADDDTRSPAASASLTPVTLSWAACGATPEATAAGVECATAALPMDYDEPEGEQVQIAVARVPAADPAQRIGSLFYNFGGPGGPAVDYLQALGPGIFAALNQRFDIVAVDPRGVGQSTPAVDCQVDDETAGYSPNPWPTPLDVDAEALVTRAQAYVDACLANNGEILEHLSTANVARDLDAIREGLGEEQLNYLGFSYGTFLGATYASLFPDRYRAMVLDSALDPDQWINDPVAGSRDQLASFENSLDRFLAACAEDQAACSGFGGEDPSTAYDDLTAQADETPIPAPNYPENPAPVSGTDIRQVTATLLYSKDLWGLLAAALAQAETGDASVFRALVDLVVYPENDASPDRFFAISASEQQWPTDVDAYLERGAEEWADFPHFWGGWAYSEIPWGLWPVEDEDAFGGPFVASPDASPVLVVQSTNDPATPYEGAVAMTEQLGNAVLLTMDGDGHGVYGGNSACIDSATDSYLVAGTLPAEDTVCPQDVPFAAPAPVPAGTATARTVEAALALVGGTGAGAR